MIRRHRLLPWAAGTFLCVILASCKDSTGTEPPNEDPTLSWLQENVVALTSTDPSVSEENFPVLGRAVGEARLVGLGEATHGTREFWTMRRKISAYLMEEKGFIAILHEAPFPNSLKIEAYVTRGEGTLAAAHQALGYWRFQEMQELLAWLRDQNLQRDGHEPLIHYFGYDCAAANWNGHKVVITEYLDRVDPASLPEIVSRLEGFTLENADYVRTFIADRAPEYVALSSQEEYALVLRVADLLEPTWRVVDALRNGTPDGNLRDSCAADNVNWIVENLLDGGKAVIWAHNAHIGSSTLGDIADAPTQWLGARLKDQLGTGYYRLGAEFYGGSFLAWETCGGTPTAFTLHQAAVPPESSYAHTFHRAGVPLFFLNLRGVDYTEEGAGWLNGPRDIRIIGADYCAFRDNEYYYSGSLPQNYDGILFFDHSSPVTQVSF